MAKLQVELRLKVANQLSLKQGDYPELSDGTNIIVRVPKTGSGHRRGQSSEPWTWGQRYTLWMALKTEEGAAAKVRGQPPEGSTHKEALSSRTSSANHSPARTVTLAQ